MKKFQSSKMQNGQLIQISFKWLKVEKQYISQYCNRSLIRKICSKSIFSLAKL